MIIGALDYLESFPQGGFMLRFSANLSNWERVKDAIKALPTADRFWNSRALGGRGAWWISDEGLERIKHLFVNYEEMRERADDKARHEQRQQENQRDSRQEYSYRQRTASSGPMTRADAFATLFLLPGAPKEVALAVHRALAKMYHPDLGGDLEKMKQINVAWDVVSASYPAEKERR